MRRAGFQVWLAPGLEGSFEELPPTLLDSLKRDRRWCQGNLQHGRLLAEPGLHGVQRLNLLLGIVAYAMAPLWLAFLVLSTLSAAQSGGAGFTRSALASLFHRGHAAPLTHTALGLFLLTVFLLLAPKLIAWGCALADGERRRSFGGAARLTASLLLETLYSACMAPILMVFHSGFLLTTLLGVRVTWKAQRRGEQETSFREAFARHGLHAVLALAWAAIAASVAPGLFWWLSPVWLPLIFAAPLSVLGSRAQPRGPRAQGRSLLDARGDVAPARARSARRRETPTRPASIRSLAPWSIRTPTRCTRSWAGGGRRPASSASPGSRACAGARSRGVPSISRRASCGTCSPMRIPSSRSTARCGASRAARTCRRSGAPRSPRSAAGAPEPSRWRSSSTSSGSRPPRRPKRSRAGCASASPRSSRRWARAGSRCTSSTRT